MRYILEAGRTGKLMEFDEDSVLWFHAAENLTMLELWSRFYFVEAYISNITKVKHLFESKV